MEKSRVQAYLQSACSVLNFDIGEIWVCRDVANSEVIPVGLRRNKDLRFIQLYTSPEFEPYRPSLVAPSEVPGHDADTEKHLFSPLICEAVRESGQVVWAHTHHEDGLLARKDLPLRTAVGAPICSIGFDLCILLMFSPAVLELTEEAHRFLFTVAQAASDAVCGFLPASVSSPVSNPAATMAKRPPPDPRTGAGVHTRALIEALPSTVTFQMVDMQAMTVSVHNPIKTEFMETFNAIYNPPPPPLMPLTAGEGGAEDDDLDIDAFDALPPLEDCFLPPDLLEDGALMEGGMHGAGGAGGGASGDDWDFGAALDFIFDKDKGQGGDGAGTPAPTTDSEWFGGGGGKGGARAGAGAGGGNPPAAQSGSSSLGALAATSSAGGSASQNAGEWLPGGGKMPAPATAQQGEGGAGESLIRFMYEDALQRLRFEEFVKGFLSMSVFHTAECWVARGADTLEQVYCATCLADIQSWVQFSSKLHTDTQRALPARVAIENRAIWERDFERLNGPGNGSGAAGAGGAGAAAAGAGNKAHVLQTAFGLPVHIDGKNRLIVIFYSSFSLEPALLMESFVKRALDLLWNKDAASASGGASLPGISGGASTTSTFYSDGDDNSSTGGVGGGAKGGSLPSISPRGSPTMDESCQGQAHAALRGVSDGTTTAMDVAAAAASTFGDAVGGLEDLPALQPFEGMDWQDVLPGLSEVGVGPVSRGTSGAGGGVEPMLPPLLGTGETATSSAMSVASSATAAAAASAPHGQQPVHTPQEHPQPAPQILPATLPVYTQQQAHQLQQQQHQQHQHHHHQHQQHHHQQAATAIPQGLPVSQPLYIFGYNPATGAHTATPVRHTPAQQPPGGGAAGPGFVSPPGVVYSNAAPSSAVPMAGGIPIPAPRPQGQQPHHMQQQQMVQQPQFIQIQAPQSGMPGQPPPGTVIYQIPALGAPVTIQGVTYYPIATQAPGQPLPMQALQTMQIAGAPHGGMAIAYRPHQQQPPPQEVAPPSAASLMPITSSQLQQQPQQQQHAQQQQPQSVPMAMAASGAYVVAGAKPGQQPQQQAQPPTPVMLMPSTGGPVVVQQVGGLPHAMRSGQAVSVPATHASSASASATAATGSAKPPLGQHGAAAAAAAGAAAQQQQHQPRMVNGQKVCKTESCGQPAAKRSPYCPSHTGARHCQYPGCTKCAQGNTKFCIAHGGGRRCTYPGCTKGARDKNFCAAHGGGKRCCIEGCTKSAVGGSFMCTAHGGGRRCQFEDCTRSAQSSTDYCVRHGGGRKCQVEGCQKVARGRTSFCAAHGGGVRCKVEGCNKAAVGKFQMCRTHSGYPKKRASEPISTTHFLENPAAKRRMIVAGEGGGGGGGVTAAVSSASGGAVAVMSLSGAALQQQAQAVPVSLPAQGQAQGQGQQPTSSLAQGAMAAYASAFNSGPPQG